MLTQETEGCIPWPYSKRDGYGRVSLGGSRSTNIVAFTHRLAYTIACGDIPEGLDVLHHCDNPPCFNPRHLFVGTDQDNKNDQKAKGRVRSGTKVNFARLTDEQVKEIRALYQPKTRWLDKRILAEQYGVSETTIYDLLKGKTWKHLL
jgi:hypothetical protein